MSEEGIPSAEPDAIDTNENPPSDPGSYHDRIRSEGEFAVGEVQKKDSYIGELHNRVNTYKSLDQWIEGAGGVDQLIDLAIKGSQAVAAPPAEEPAVPAEDLEIFDPEVKALDERYGPQLAAQSAEIKALREQLSVTSAAAVKGTLTENIGSALDDFSAFPELETKAREKIMGAVEASERLAKAGDTSHARNLEQLAGDKGPEAIRMILVDMYREMALAGKPTPTESNGETKPLSTDAPSNTRAVLGTDEVVVEAGTRVTANTVREVMESLSQKRGKDPRSVFG